MTWILGILFLLGAAAWGYCRYRREADRDKPVLVCMLCGWWLAGVLCPLLTSLRNPIYLVLAAWSFRWAGNARLSSAPFRLNPALFFFLALIAVSEVWAVNPEDAGLRATGLFLAFVFIRNLLRTTEIARVVVWLVDGLLYASYATLVLVAVGGAGTDPEDSGERFHATNDLLATGTAMLCMWALVRLFVEGMCRQGNRRRIHFVLAAIALAAMLRTGTRGTAIQLVVVLPLLASFRLPATNFSGLVMRYALIALLALSAGVAVWTSLGEQRRIVYEKRFRISKDEGVEDSRSFVWKPAMAKANKRPWLGRGFGSSSFFEFGDEEYSAYGWRGPPWRSTVHSQFLEIYYEFGLVGFGVFIWLLGCMLWNVVRIYAHSGPQAQLWRMLAVYALVGVVEGLTHGGQITTGGVMLIERWILYCCVLSFPAAASTQRQVVAPARLPPEMPRRGMGVALAQALRPWPANASVSSFARLRWSRPAIVRNSRSGQLLRARRRTIRPR